MIAAASPRRLLALVLVASAAIVGGALLFQYVGGLAPCELCLYQRWPYYAAILASGIALLSGSDRALEVVIGLCALLFAASTALAFYHGGARIYDGQLAMLGRSRSAAAIRAMAEQEKRHLAAFEHLVVARRVRPTLLAPLWHAAGFALGAATALMGERAAMACTVAVEEVIDEHYRDQVDRLGETEPELTAAITQLRAHEIQHRDTRLAHRAQQAPAHPAAKGPHQ